VAGLFALPPMLTFVNATAGRLAARREVKRALIDGERICDAVCGRRAKLQLRGLLNSLRQQPSGAVVQQVPAAAVQQAPSETLRVGMR
jgi:hypothetical protein